MATPKEQLLSRTVYDTNGTTTIWEFAFSGGYLDPSHVKAYTVNAVGTRTDLVINPATDLVGQFQLRVQPALATGLELVIYRDTPKNLPLVDFTDESGFSEIALDTNAKQGVFIAAEAIDTVNALDVVAAIDAAEAAGTAATASQQAAADSAASAAASASAVVLAQAEAVAAQNSADAAAASAASVNSANLVQVTGNQTIGGVKTFTSPIVASGGGTINGTLIFGNATSPNTHSIQFGDSTGWVLRYMTSVSGTPTERFRFADTGHFTAVGNITAGGQFLGNVTGNVTGNAGTVTNGVYTTGDQTIGGTKTFTGNVTVNGNITAGGQFIGSGASLNSLPASQLTGDVAAGRIANALNATGSAPIYACRAWVNFNGTGTVAIRASGNVSSITDNGVGDYTVNFTTAMPDANYSPVFGYGTNVSASVCKICVLTTAPEGVTPTLQSTTQLRVISGGHNVSLDFGYLQVAIFR